MSRRQDLALAGQPSDQGFAADGPQGGHHQADRLAYLPAHLQVVAGRNRQRCQGGAGADASRQNQHDDGGLRAGGQGNKRAAQRNAVDPLLGRKPTNTSNEGAEMECSHTVPGKAPLFPECAV